MCRLLRGERPETLRWERGAGLPHRAAWLQAPGVKAHVAQLSPAASSRAARAAPASRGAPGQLELRGSLDCPLITLSFTNSRGVFLLQLRGYCLWLCQLPQADLREGRLPDGVLLSLQADMAPQPNLRHGPPAKGADPASTNQAHVGPQLRTGVRPRYAFTPLLVTPWVLGSSEYTKQSSR